MSVPLGAAAALASSCTWAYASSRYALAAREVAAVRVNLVRMAVALPVWLAIALAGGRPGDGLTTRHVAWATVSVICSYAVADGLFFAAARRLGAASALSIASTYPLWAACKGALLDGERFGPSRVLGTVLCVGGVMALVRLGSSRPTASGRGRGGGAVLALFVSLLWAMNTVAIKAASPGISLPTLTVCRYGLALALLGTSLVVRPPSGPRAPAGGWGRLVPAIFFDLVLGGFFFLYGLAHTDLAVGATLSSLAPLVSLPIALVLKTERLSRGKLAAVVVVVAGVVLLSAGA